MKTTKKILVLCLIAVMAMVAVMPSTFSWYAHSGEEDYQGNAAQYARSGLPLSVQRSTNSSELSMETYKADKFGKKTGNALSSFDSISHGTTQRYITTISNSDTTHDFYLDLEMSNITNSTKVFIGLESPVVNEKCYASRADTPKVDYDKTRVYFEPRNDDLNTDTERDGSGVTWWENYVAPANVDYTNSSGFTNDMNIKYGTASSSDNNLALTQISGGYDKTNNKKYQVYYGDVPSDLNYFYFFNHYFITSSNNKNRNQSQTEYTAPSGYVCYLTGSENSYSNKTFNKYDNFKETLANARNCYKTVTMAKGRTADISLTSMADDSEKYDYTGKSISYSSDDTSVATVSNAGLITAVNTGDCTITTTITGEFGDTLSLETAVSVPDAISQVPIVQNIKVPAGKSVDVVWYVKNSDSSNSASFSNIFYTI